MKRILVSIASAAATVATAAPPPVSHDPATPSPDALVVPVPTTTDAGRSVTFAQTISLATAQASDARIAADELARAHALLDEAAAALLPLVGVSATYQQLEGDRYVEGKEFFAAASFLGQITGSLPVLNFRERADRRRADDQVDVARTSVLATQRAVAIQAGKAYLAVLAAQRIIQVAELARATAQAHVDYATRQHAGGLGTELDIVRAQAELATDEEQLALAQTALVRSEEALGVLTGQNTALAPTDEPDLEAKTGAGGIEHRADIINARSRQESAKSSLDLQWTEWAPTLSLNGTGFYTAPQLDPTPRFGFAILLVLSMPLYDGGYRSGLRQERTALEAEAREQLAQTERAASSEIRVDADAVARAKQAQAAAHRSADFATRALALANIAYKGGTGTGLDVIDAQRSARDAATQAVIADDNLHQAELDLLAASGAFP